MSKKKKSHTLEMKPEHTPALFGIISSEHDYALSFQINKALAIELTKQDDFVLEQKDKEALAFSSFYYTTPDELFGYQLLKNKSGNRFLAPEQKSIDFFLLVFGDTEASIIASLHVSLKQMTGINVVMLLDINKIKVFNKLFL